MNRDRLLLVIARVFAGLMISGMLVFSGSTNLAFANPPSGHGSNFEDADGNLAVDTTGHFDWNAPINPIVCPSAAPGAGTNCGLDLVNNKADDSLGQGSKEDDVSPTIVTGSIPPSKDDLSRLYFNLQTVGSGTSQKVFLFLAWERSNLLGSAHMDFELNQNRTPSANGVTPLRTANDLLVDFDFGGSGVPDLTLHKWITGSNGETAADCEAATALPCWNKAVDLTGTEAEAAVNNAPVTDANNPGAPFTLAGNTKNGINSTFGEAGIDLTEANIFPSNVCEHFGAAWLKSRSSGNSFTSELKDFIAPIPINISNCGNIIIRKVTVPSPDPTNTSFAYTTTGGLTPSTFSLKNGGNQDYGNKVLAGSYSVSETAPSSPFTFTSLDCSASSVTNGSTTSVSGATVNIVLKPGDVVDCTYTNTLQQGAIKITKTSSKTSATPLAGAKFSISSGGSAITGSPFTTGSDGTVCVDHLVYGTYSVQETAAPTGYAIDDSTAHNVTVNTTTTCGSGNETAFSATDTPLTDLVVKATSEVSGGTKTTITCVDSGSANIGNSPVGPIDPAQVTANGLKPGTYTCTVVVDP